MSELGKYSPQHRGGLHAGDTDSVDLTPENHGPHRMNRKQTAKMLSKYLNYYFWRVRIFQTVILILQDVLDFGCRIRDADAIFRIERKDDQKIAQKSKLFYRKYFEFTSNHSGSVCGTLWRIVSKYILFFCAWFSRFTVGTCRTRRITIWAPRKITTDHDMRPIRLITPFVNRKYLSKKQKLQYHDNPFSWITKR